MKAQQRLAAVVIFGLVLAGCGSGTGSSVDPASSGPVESADAAWEPEFIDGVLQPLPDGFPDRPINLLNPDDPGSTDGIYSRMMQAALEEVSPVEIALSDRQFGSYGTWEALGYLSEQPGGDEGYWIMPATVGGTALDLLATPVQDELDVSLDDFNVVIVTEFQPFFLIQNKQPPWGSTSFDDFVDYVHEHPGEVNYICFAVGSGRDIYWTYYEQTLDLEFREPKTCIDDSQQIDAIIGSGEGDVGLNPPADTLTSYQAGRTDPIFVTGAQPAPEPWTDIPNGADATGNADDPWGTYRGITTTAGVPDLHRAWLFELVRAAHATDTFQEARATLPGVTQLDPVFDHEEAMALARRVMELGTPILREAGMLVSE